MRLLLEGRKKFNSVIINNQKMKKKIIGLAVLSLCVLVLAGCGGKSSNNQKQGPGSTNNMPSDKNQLGIPAEVIAYCQGKSDGDACDLISPQNSEKQSGTCKEMGNSGQLVCLPANMPAGLSGNADGNGPAPTQDRLKQ
jgi:hypothetical protein